MTQPAASSWHPRATRPPIEPGQIWQTMRISMEFGIITINEALDAKGLPPVPWDPTRAANNAGIALMAPIDSFSLSDFDRTFAVNVRAVFAATQAAIKHMKEGGRIINIGSCNAERMPFAGGAVYAMSKAALVGLVKGLSRDLGPRGITINNIQPGPVDTDLNPATGDFAEMLKKVMALPRYGHADEIAAMVAYLAGPEAGFVTGASLTIDGGFTA